jgi:membrane protein CcdC involved in cytochrome C biogenesis
MSLRIRIKIAVVILVTVITLTIIFGQISQEAELFSKHFFDGLLHGLVFSVVIFWGISSLVKYYQKRKQINSGDL